MTSSIVKDKDRGSLTVELVVLTPVLVIFAMLAIGLGRYEIARGRVVAAASAAASAASAAASAAVAEPDASDAAEPVLGGGSHICSTFTVMADLSRFSPGGSVTVSVSCQVTLADLLVPGLPGVTTVRASSRAPIDPYREFG